VNPMSDATWDPNGTKKSCALVAVPYLVLTETCPDAVEGGTCVAREAPVAEASHAGERLNFTTSFAGVESKPVPLMVTEVPVIPLPGEKFVIVGAPLPLVTVKGDELVAVPEGTVTLTGPVVAPLGTATTNCVALADVTTAAVPLNDTES
jgi:hypothetical protein